MPPCGRATSAVLVLCFGRQPSVASVQFGDGSLMGPLGQVLGSALNWLLGLASYFAVATLVVVSLRIFAGATGLRRRNVARPTVWRARVGAGLSVLFGATLLHLIFRSAGPATSTG